MATYVILVERIYTLHEMDAAEVQLARAIDAAGASVRSDAKATPRPIDRSTIYHFVGSLASPLGRRRRVALDAAAARRVLPLISRAFYDDDPDGTDSSTRSGLLAAVDLASAANM